MDLALRLCALGSLLIVAGILVAAQTLAGPITDFVIGIVFMALIVLAFVFGLRFGRV